MPLIGPWELIILLVIVVVIFGAGRLSQIGGALGKSVKEFRQATVDETTPAASAASTAAPAPAPSATVSAPAVAVAAPVTKTCASCGHENGATQSFCSDCGKPLSAPEPRENICPSCATVNPTGQAFCGQCGTRLTSRAA
jgi:sec-independent protein translocase protein TatA